MFSQKTVVLGVCSSVALYKTLELIRLLKKQGINVLVMMSSGARQLISPQLFAAVSGNPVARELFSETDVMPHIDLAKAADLIVICPATANIMAKLANGLADDLLTTVVLASSAKTLICPAMNPVMWGKLVTKNNRERLEKFGFTLIDPAFGETACGDNGFGCLAPLEIIEETILANLTKQDLAGKKILITTGSTIEKLDPVRYLSNFSSGKMGLSLAKIAARRGAEVVLVGNKELGIKNNELRIMNKGLRINKIEVESAEEMYRAVMKNISGQDVFISAAAVSDFRPKIYQKSKIKKNLHDKNFIIDCLKNPDILLSVSKKRGHKKKPILVGFALETDEVLPQARLKLKAKNVDIILANNQHNLGADDKQFSLITVDQNIDWPLMPVDTASNRLFDSLSGLFFG